MLIWAVGSSISGPSPLLFLWRLADWHQTQRDMSEFLFLFTFTWRMAIDLWDCWSLLRQTFCWNLCRNLRYGSNNIFKLRNYNLLIFLSSSRNIKKEHHHDRHLSQPSQYSSYCLLEREYNFKINHKKNSAESSRP